MLEVVELGLAKWGRDGSLSAVTENILKPDGSRVESQFSYGGRNGVTTRTVDGVPRNYRIDPTTGATLSEESGGTTTRYSYDDSGGLMSSSDSSQVLYYHFGTDGNVYALTTGGSTPQVAGSASYDLQGNSLFGSGSIGGQPYQSGGMGGDYTISGDGGLQLVQVGGETESTSSGESYDVVGEWVMYDQHIPPPEGTYHTMPFLWPVLFRMLSDADPCREPIDWSSMVIGFGDGLTFGATRPIRRAILKWGWGDTEDVANSESVEYLGGYLVGETATTVSTTVVGLGGWSTIRNSWGATRMVTSWAPRGLTSTLRTGRWVMLGGRTAWNYLGSGIFLTYPYVNAVTAPVPAQYLRWPPGWEIIKGLWGQRIYIGPPVP